MAVMIWLILHYTNVAEAPQVLEAQSPHPAQQAPFPCRQTGSWRFSNDKQNPPPRNVDMDNFQDGNGSKTGVHESKKTYTEEQVEIMRLRSELEKKEMQSEMQKLRQKYIDMIKQKDEENGKKKRDEESRRERCKPRNWNIFTVTPILALLAAIYGNYQYQWGNKIQEKLGIQKLAAKISTKQSVEALLEKYSNTKLKVAQFYVSIPQLEKEVDRCLKYFDRRWNKDVHGVKLFQVLTGFPGYGKSTAFAQRINRLRDEVEEIRKEQNRKMEEKMTFWGRLKFWEKPHEQPYRKIFYFHLRGEDENEEKT